MFVVPRSIASAIKIESKSGLLAALHSSAPRFALHSSPLKQNQNQLVLRADLAFDVFDENMYGFIDAWKLQRGMCGLEFNEELQWRMTYN
ncbi:hypothetical protein U1Q18_026205 [Sarracenia purpurea var. burkii]